MRYLFILFLLVGCAKIEPFQSYTIVMKNSNGRFLKQWTVQSRTRPRFTTTWGSQIRAYSMDKKFYDWESEVIAPKGCWLEIKE